MVNNLRETIMDITLGVLDKKIVTGKDLDVFESRILESLKERLTAETASDCEKEVEIDNTNLDCFEKENCSLTNCIHYEKEDYHSCRLWRNYTAECPHYPQSLRVYVGWDERAKQTPPTQTNSEVDYE